jgi:tRNA threonylcarbamoyladenosine biosynthesis protein TsaE
MINGIKIISKSANETKNIAKKIADLLRKEKFSSKATVIGLQGELGGGKTTFVQGLISSFGVKEKILSPTFVIMKNFEVKGKTQYFKKIYHFDVYRIGDEKEMDIIGFKEIINNPDNLVLVEWSNLIKKTMPKDSILINFEFKDENTRNIMISLPSTNVFNKFKMLSLN